MDCYLPSIEKSYYNFERYLKNNLSDDKPLFPVPKFQFKHKIRSNPEILCNEIFNRSLLLTIRFAKMIFSVIVCLASPASLLTEKLLAPNPAWERFCKEARYFTAESFEFVGVVVFSILLLPFNRNNSPFLVNGQAWVEQKAEWISGEKETVDSIQKIINSAKAKKELLLKARNIIEVDQKDIEKWVDKAVDFDIILEDMNISKRRRISRNYKAIPSYEKLDDKLAEIGSIISDRIDTVAILKLKKTLICLKGLFNFPEQSVRPSNILIFSNDSSDEVNPDSDLGCDEIDSLETKLEVFKRIQTEINQTIDQLHEIHDSTHELKKEFEGLNKELGQAISDAHSKALREFILNHCKGGGVVGVWQRVQDHFFFVRKKFHEILYIYSYTNVTLSGEVFSQNFVSDLREQIAECRQLLENALRTWDISSTLPLDRQRALEILGLTATATFNETRKSYLRLALIHHPDKGGQEEVFKRIKEAYELLETK